VDIFWDTVRTVFVKFQQRGSESWVPVGYWAKDRAKPGSPLSCGKRGVTAR